MSIDARQHEEGEEREETKAEVRVARRQQVRDGASTRERRVACSRCQATGAERESHTTAGIACVLV